MSDASPLLQALQQSADASAARLRQEIANAQITLAELEKLSSDYEHAITLLESSVRLAAHPVDPPTDSGLVRDPAYAPEPEPTPEHEQGDDEEGTEPELAERG